MAADVAQYADEVKYRDRRDESGASAESVDEYLFHACGGDIDKAERVRRLRADAVLKWMLLGAAIEQRRKMKADADEAQLEAEQKAQELLNG